jgi:hypothetical protein
MKAKTLLLLAVLLSALVSLLTTCRSEVAAGQQAWPLAYTLYLNDPFGPGEFLPVSVETLKDVAGAKPLAAPLISADGSTGVDVEHTAGRANPDPQTAWVIVYDLRDGRERARFHPPVSGLAVGLSADGRRLLWQPFLPLSTYPPPLDWYVLDTAGGAVAGRVYDEDNGCFRQSALLAPDGRRLYCLVDPALHEISGPQPVRVVAYEVGDRDRAAEVALETRVGQRPATDGAGWELLEPALALSPDGTTLAVVHAETEAITLIDAAGLSITKTFTPRRPGNIWDWLGLAATTAHAKGEMWGTIRQATFSADGRFLYIFSQEMARGLEEPPAERGLRLVDLERELILGEALPEYQIQWVLPAPDGSLYAFGTADDLLMPYEIRETSPSALWRLDGRTLGVLAARDFIGYRAGRLAGE